MGLSATFLDGHIAEWENRLKHTSQSHRQRWPSRLFHHTPIENAVNILTSGHLLSRIDGADSRTRDVAATDVIGRSSRAHDRVRLYFRPRTPTQFNIEGIRKAEERPSGDKAHAPVLVMFVFDARRVLSSDEVWFSDSNMQQSKVIEGRSEADFLKIPFEKVFHEGGFAGDDSIKLHRCAEVLVRSPMLLDNYLQWVFCRSEAERTFLLHLLSNRAVPWEKRIRVSENRRLFYKDYTFVCNVMITNEGLIFRLEPRKDLEPVAINVRAWNDDDQLVLRFETGSLAAQPPTAAAWRVNAKLKSGSYKVMIEVEGHKAYDAVLKLDDLPF